MKRRIVDISKYRNTKFLVFGGSGSLGKRLLSYLTENNIAFKAPSSKELDLNDFSYDELFRYLNGFVPDVIINASGLIKIDSCIRNLVEFEKLMRVNTYANYKLIDYFSKRNIKVKFILISSSASSKGREGLAFYSMSKAALNALVEAMSQDGTNKNVIITLLIPEKFESAFTDSLEKASKLDRNNFLSIDYVVESIMNSVENEVSGSEYLLRNALYD